MPKLDKRTRILYHSGGSRNDAALAAHGGSMAYGLCRGDAEKLLDWYRKNARDLPWRRESDAYRVLVSETMLQQTRIAVVEKRYPEFIARFPGIRELAAADEDDVMKAWQGLGYYSRARSLHACARAAAQEYEGKLPASYPLLLALPGIGDYTASAIAAIAYKLPCPVVDGNVLRVLARFCADPGDVARPSALRRARAALEGAIPREDPGGFAQALMELGETVCLPNAAPLCERCPLRAKCRAFAEGTCQSYPVRSPRPARRREEINVLAYVSGGRLLLEKRPKGGLLAGTWGLPVLPEGSLLPEGAEPFAEHRHAFTHVEWIMRGFLVRGLPDPLPENAALADAEEVVSRYAVATAFMPFVKKILALPEMKAGGR